MTLTQLRYFLAVIKAGSISGASAQIHIAQPALSQRLKQLEQELGHVLFKRLPKGIELTPAGQKLKVHALEILRRIDSVHDDFLSSNDNPVGEVVLGMSTAINTTFCVDVLEQVSSTYPNIKLTLVESMSGTLLEWAESGRVDLAVVYDTPSSIPLAVHHLGQENLYLVSDPDSYAHLPKRIRMSEMATLPLILPAFPQTLRLMIEKAFIDTLGQGPYVMANVDSTYAIKKLVAAGKGHTILSVLSIGDELKRHELCITPIEQPSISRSVNIVSHHNYRLDAAVSAVHRIVQDIVTVGLSTMCR